MADFWNELGDNIVKGVNVLADKTGEIVDKIADKTNDLTDKGRTKWEQHRLLRERKELATELGEMFFCMMRDDTLDTDKLQRQCDEITSLDRKIDELAADETPSH